MIEKQLHITETYNLIHRHDDDVTTDRFDYENELYIKTCSEQLLKNDINYNFILQLQDLQVYMLETILPIRNFWNMTVSKYYNKHIN
jgi:hypothetical protein